MRIQRRLVGVCRTFDAVGFRANASGDQGAARVCVWAFSTTYDESKHTLKISSTKLKQQGDFTYSQPDTQHLVLRGTLNGNAVIAGFHRLDDSTLLLTSRGFHWINEDPFNR